MENLKPIVRQLPLVQGLSEDHLELISGCARNIRASAGTFMFREGESAKEFYVIREGNVSVELHAPGRGPMTVQTVAEGEVLGWSWLFPPYTWHFDARVVEDARMIAFDAGCLRTKCDKEPVFGYELHKRFSRIMTQRIEALSFQLMDVYGEHS